MNKETIKYLNQTKGYLEQISAVAYTKPIEQMSNSTIGQHTRHFLECYQCLVNQYLTGEICYDNRARNIELETNPRLALNVLNNITKTITTIDPSKPLILKTNLPSETTIISSFNRELLYNYEHTTHHLALIRVGLTLLKLDIQLPKNFGVANSTIVHRNSVVLNN